MTGNAVIDGKNTHIDIYINGKVERKRIIVDKQKQAFTFNYETKPDLVNVDAEKMLLGVKTENKTLEEYTFQYKNAPLYVDRKEAIEAVSQYQYESPAYRQLVESALYDKHWAIRQFALDTLLLDGNTSQQIKDRILDLGYN